MKLINKYKNVELIITEKLLTQLGEYGKKHYPNEYGGFLIGNYSYDLKQLYVSDFVLPKKYKGIATLFERSVDGIKEIFEKIFSNTKQYYVGEWHTHPNGSTMYSQTDLQAMITIEECKTVKIKNPILLIICVDNNGLLDIKFYLYDNGGLTEYE